MLQLLHLFWGLEFYPVSLCAHGDKFVRKVNKIDEIYNLFKDKAAVSCSTVTARLGGVGFGLYTCTCLTPTTHHQHPCSHAPRHAPPIHQPMHGPA